MQTKIATSITLVAIFVEYLLFAKETGIDYDKAINALLSPLTKKGSNMFMPRLLAFSVAGLISLASFLPQTQPNVESRVASLENTQVAMVQRIAALETIVASPVSNKAKNIVTPTPTKENVSPYEIVSFNERIIESSRSYDTHSWVVTLKSNSDKTLLLNARVEFLDKDGFLLLYDFINEMVLKPHEERSFSNTRLLGIALSSQVVNTTVKIDLEPGQ